MVFVRQCSCLLQFQTKQEVRVCAARLKLGENPTDCEIPRTWSLSIMLIVPAKGASTYQIALGTTRAEGKVDWRLSALIVQAETE